jgi:hypothetical protein
MKYFQSRWETRIPVIDSAIGNPVNLKELERLKQTFEQQSLPVWFLSIYHDNYAVLGCASSPFNIREMRPNEIDEQPADAPKPHRLEGKMGALDNYKICYPDNSEKRVFSAWPGAGKKLGSLWLADSAYRKYKLDQQSYVIGEKGIAEQLGVWEVEDPRIERLSEQEVNAQAECLFAQRHKSVRGLGAVLRDHSGFICLAKEFDLTPKDVLRCVDRLYEVHGRELEAH